MINLGSLDKAFKNKDKVKEPTNLQYIYHFFLEKGISLNEFVLLPIPYIMEVLMTAMYLNKKEREELDKEK